MRRILPCLLAAGALLAPVATSSAQKPPKPPGQQEVTLRASSTLLTFSNPVTLTASIKGNKGGTNVTLQRRPVTSTVFSDVETKPTDAKGDATFSHRPRVNTIYRAIARTVPEQTSPETRVNVAPLVGFKVSDSTPRVGQRVRFAGTVRPRHTGRRVSIQRQRADGTFATIRRATLKVGTTRYSRYALRVRVRRTGTYRVRLAGHTDHVAGVSRERTLTTP